MAEKLDDRLIVALDLPDAYAAQEMVQKLDGIVSFFKLGWWLILEPNFSPLLSTLIDRGKRVFLDAKLFDIPATVRTGVARAAARGVSFITVRGDPDIVQAAMEASCSSDLRVLAISTLTSANSLSAYEFPECGGMIVAPPDLHHLQRPRPDFMFVTPGVRLPGEPLDDHRRVGTPAAAIRNGADYIVVGRPIIHAPEPAKAALNVIRSMEQGT